MSDDLREALRRMAGQIEAEAKTTTPSRLISPEVESALHRSFTQPGIRVFFGHERPLPPPLTRTQRIRAWFSERRWRISKAWDHLRGIECESDW